MSLRAVRAVRACVGALSRSQDASFLLYALPTPAFTQSPSYPVPTHLPNPSPNPQAMNEMTVPVKLTTHGHRCSRFIFTNL